MARQLLYFLVLALLTFGAYSNHFDNAFHFDDFHTVVDYFRNMLYLDITGNSADHYQMSFNILDVFFASNRFLKGMPNGSTFVISENTFAEQPAHVVMVGNETLRIFGFEEDSRRLAAFVVDWWTDEGEFVAGY